jgi:hypothetical protein
MVMILMMMVMMMLMMMVFDYELITFWWIDNCYDDNDGYRLSVTCIVYDEFYDCNFDGDDDTYGFDEDLTCDDNNNIGIMLFNKWWWYEWWWLVMS